MLKYYLSILYLTFFNLLLAQNKNPVTGTVYLDNGRVDSLIKATITLPLSQSYYVFLYPTAGALTSWGPQVIKEYKGLTQKGIQKCNEDILFIFNNNGGFQESFLKEEFFKHIFLFTDKDIQKVKYVINDSLYNLLNSGGTSVKLVKLLYIYQNKLVYIKPCKLYSIRDWTLPHDQFEIVNKEPIEIQTDTFIFREIDEILPFKDNKLLISLDVTDDLIELDIPTGKIGKSFSTRLLNATDFYCQYFAQEDTAKCNFAKKNEHIWKSGNRQALDILYLQTDSFNNIYCSLSIEAFEKNEDIYTYRNDENKKVVITKDRPVLAAHFGILKLDTDLKIKNVYLENNSSNNNKKVYQYFDNGFYVNNDNSFLVANNFSDFSSSLISFLSPKKHAFAEFKLNNNMLSFNRFLNAYTYKPLPKMDFCWIRTFFIKFNDKKYAMFNVSGNIWEVDSHYPVSELAGDGNPKYIKEIYPQYTEDTTVEKINFDIQYATPIFNEEYLAVLYKYQGKLLCEIKNKKLTTIYVTDLTKIPGFNKYCKNNIRSNICIHQNTILFPVLENDKFWLYRYDIKQACK